MKVVIIDKQTGLQVAEYEADAPDQSKFGGPWGDAVHTEHIPAEVFTNKKPPKIKKVRASKKAPQ